MVILSVIIPVYNCEQYIAECLNSVIRQNFAKNEYEIIVINDGSTDSTPQIISNFVKKYDFIHLTNNAKQVGVSNSRNTGLMMAKGQYITFVDADDYVVDNIYPNIIDKLFSEMACDYFYFCRASKPSGLSPFQNAFYEAEKERALRPAVCRCVYKSSIIKNNALQFNENMKYNEDYLFNYKYMQYCKRKIYGTSLCYYYYRPHNNQTTKNIKKTEKARLEYYNSTFEFCREVKQFKNDSKAFNSALYEVALSSAIASFLWGVVITKSNPKKAINDLNNIHINLKDSKVKVYEGAAFKYKFKSWLEYKFRYKIIFKMTCLFYKIFFK